MQLYIPNNIELNQICTQIEDNSNSLAFHLISVIWASSKEKSQLIGLSSQSLYP